MIAPNSISIKSLVSVKFLGSLVLTGLLLAAVFRTESLESLWGMLKSVNKTGVLCYIAISVFALIVRALRYLVVLRTACAESLSEENLKKVNFSALVIVTSIRNALVDFLPARLGELSYFYVLRRYGVNIAHATSTFGICFAFDIAILALLLLLLGVLSPYYSGMNALVNLEEVSTLTLLLVATSLLIIFLLTLRLDILAQRGFKVLKAVSSPFRTSSFRQSLLNFAERITTDIVLVRKRGGFFRIILMTIALRLAKYVSLYVLLLSVVSPQGVSAGDLDPVISTLAFLAAEASASLPVSGLMGFGAYEGAWSLIFSLNNTEIPSLPSVILLVHLITQVVGYSFALLALSFFLIKEVKS